MLKQKYSINELAGFAVEIEKQGNAFYTAQAAKTKNPEAKKIFEFLAEQEEVHRQRYLQLLSQIDHSVNVGSTYSDDYYDYLRVIVDDVVFKKENPPVTNDADVIEYAIGKEKDSILFYREMIGMIPIQHADVIQTIIEEEQYHIVQLLNMKEIIG